MGTRIPNRPSREDWTPWTVKANGWELEETLETTAHQELTELTERFNEELEKQSEILLPTGRESERTRRKEVRDVYQGMRKGHRDMLEVSAQHSYYMQRLYQDKNVMSAIACNSSKQEEHRLKTIKKELSEMKPMNQQLCAHVVDTEEQLQNRAQQHDFVTDAYTNQVNELEQHLQMWNQQIQEQEMELQLLY